jgi:hypothetical protein
LLLPCIIVIQVFFAPLVSSPLHLSTYCVTRVLQQPTENISTSQAGPSQATSSQARTRGTRGEARLQQGEDGVEPRLHQGEEGEEPRLVVAEPPKLYGLHAPVVALKASDYCT